METATLTLDAIEIPEGVEFSRDRVQRELEIMQNKIDGERNRTVSKHKTTVEQIVRDGTLLRDFITPLGINGDRKNQMVWTPPQEDDEPVTLAINPNGELVTLELHPHAAYQAGEKLAMPAAYVRDLVGSQDLWKRQLAAKMLNDYSEHTKRQRVLVRAVGGEVRGILSDAYRRINGNSIMQTFLQTAMERGAVVWDADYDGIRTWVRIIFPQVVPIITPNNGVRYTVFGIRVSNSEFGDGALDLRTFMLEVRCLNGLVGEKMMREIHLGRRFGDDMQLSDRTYKLDTDTVASAVQDVTRQLLSVDIIKSRANLLVRASATRVEMDDEVKKLTSKNQLSKGEGDAVKKVLVGGNPENGVQGESTLLKLVNAITAVGRDTTQVRRKNEIQELAGNILSRLN